MYSLIGIIIICYGIVVFLILAEVVAVMIKKRNDRILQNRAYRDVLKGQPRLPL